MKRPIKIVVSGAVGAGKTTFIQNLSETPVVNTEAQSSENIGKASTTVAMDFGTLTLNDIEVHLFGTPGQDRFDFMWKILLKGSLGLILLVAGDQPDDFPKAKHILEFITSQIDIPFIIGVTKQDLPMVWEPRDVADYFELDLSQVIGLNATDMTSAVSTLSFLLEHVDQYKDYSHEA